MILTSRQVCHIYEILYWHGQCLLWSSIFSFSACMWVSHVLGQCFLSFSFGPVFSHSLHGLGFKQLSVFLDRYRYRSLSIIIIDRYRSLSIIIIDRYRSLFTITFDIVIVIDHFCLISRFSWICGHLISSSTFYRFSRFSHFSVDF